MYTPGFENLFYEPDIDSGVRYLNAGESNHCIRVLRHRLNDAIYIVDGRGSLYHCKIITPDVNQCAFEVVDRFPEWKKRSYQIHIGISPIKNTIRFEWFLEKAVELGIDEITLVISRFTLRQTMNLSRLEKIMISAMKQSKQAHRTRINPPVNIQSFFASSFSPGHRYIAHQSDTAKPLSLVYPPGSNTILVVGPEGGFSDQEIELAEKSEFQQVLLNPNRLRTETAGVVATAIIHSLNTDLH